MAKFKQAACDLKQELTGDQEANFTVYKPNFFVDDFTREEFERICMPIFNKMLEPVIRVLAKAKLSKDKINRLVLVGGTTLIPIVRQMIIAFFDHDILVDIDTNP